MLWVLVTRQSYTNVHTMLWVLVTRQSYTNVHTVLWVLVNRLMYTDCSGSQSSDRAVLMSTEYSWS